MTNPDLPSQAAKVPELTSRIISVRELLLDPALAIPPYQRPYKWTGRNINQLFSDVAVHKDKSSYRLGTIVFHEAPLFVVVRNVLIVCMFIHARD